VNAAFVPFKLSWPDADVPTIQLSLKAGLDPREHLAIGRALAPLRDEGVLVVGSGNLVHNLHAYAWGRHTPDPYDWAVQFETEAKEMMLAGEYKPLIEYEKLGKKALLSIPTPEHYLPLLYVVATRQPGELIAFPVEGVDGGSISMLSVQIG
jgi:4,5-DOPA dioxygenase extradiol